MPTAPGIALALGLLACAWSIPSAADDGFVPPTVEAINAAIDRGVAALRALQHEDGSWGPCVAGGVYGSSVAEEGACCATGPTTFALFTLAKCGVDARAPEVRKGLRWLREQEHGGGQISSYESAAVVLMLVALHEEDVAKAQARRRTGRPLRGTTTNPPAGVRIPRDDWRWLCERIDHLASCQVESGGFGYWGSDGDPQPESAHYVYADISATHFALLALRDASRAGCPVEEVCQDVWGRAAAYLLEAQLADGGFGYRPRETWSAGMTAAGAAGLVLCREQLAQLEQPLPPDLDAAIERALVRMGQLFDPSVNRQGKGPASHEAGYYHYYYLYGIERVGDLTGRRELGGLDWYLRGAAWLLGRQRADGTWFDGTCMLPRDTLGTCFALLFLKRATIPVITTSGD